MVSTKKTNIKRQGPWVSKIKLEQQSVVVNKCIIYSPKGFNDKPIGVKISFNSRLSKCKWHFYSKSWFLHRRVLHNYVFILAGFNNISLQTSIILSSCCKWSVNKIFFVTEQFWALKLNNNFDKELLFQSGKNGLKYSNYPWIKKSFLKLI